MSILTRIKPIVSEKSLIEQDKGIYQFYVDKTANKNQVKQFVEKMFDVEVEKVNTIRVKGKKKNNWKKRRVYNLPERKKAIVYIKGNKKIKQLTVSSK
jgi:large subunit ribosomal protein L23